MPSPGSIQPSAHELISAPLRWFAYQARGSIEKLNPLRGK